VIDLAKKPFADAAPADAVAEQTPAEGETAAQSGRIDEFLGGLSVVPVRNSQIVEIRYSSS
jgi:hypothetical protein